MCVCVLFLHATRHRAPEMQGINEKMTCVLNNSNFVYFFPEFFAELTLNWK
mgnify:CR=1 FL=1|jgi:hypothetical protein